jgi:DNA-directed RNA polymerase specialized sigma54-like protein
MGAFIPSALDERGYSLSHQTRVRNAIQAVAKNDMSIYWDKCKLLGSAGVGLVDIQEELISTDRASRVLKILDAWG